MPCYMTGSAEGDANLAASEARREATRLTRLLCVACALLEQSHKKLPAQLKEWWDNHKKVDEARKNRERQQEGLRAARERARGKLTPLERKALGLK